MLFKKDNIKIIGIYIGVSIVSILILFWILELWKADLKVPFVYEGDVLLYSTIIKGVIDNGWHLRNPFIGMPTGALMYDFTDSYNFHMLVIKVISLFTSDWALVMNIFFLITFPLTTLCSFYVFRKFKFSYLPSIAGSLLYTFLPYHFFRNEGHLILAAYYIIPLMVMVILWVASGEIPFPCLQKGSKIDSKLISSVVICVITASSGVYYPFFACIFLLAAGIKAFCTQKNKRIFFLSLFLIVVIFSAVLINLSPTLIYQHKNGKNLLFKRLPHESEMGGLKVTQLMLPVDGHRVALIAKFKETYNMTAPLLNESRWASLGIIGSIGFLILIIGLFFRKAPLLNNEGQIVEHISLLNIIGLLYGTIGGFGSLFAYAIFPQFRALNRISIYLAFFALFMVVILFEKLREKYVISKSNYILYIVGTVLLIFFGLFDQTTKYFVFPYDSTKKEYRNDTNFFEKIETSLPAGSMIFQLPIMSFPYEPPVYGLDSLQHIRGYLHSKKLRWSYGTIRGREGDLWQIWVTLKPLNDFCECISLAGFNGIYIDRLGYPDRGAEIENKLEILLKKKPTVNDNNRFIVFDIKDFGNNMNKNPSSVVKSSIPGLKKMQPVILPGETRNIRYNIDIVKDYKNFIEISGWAFIKGKSSENSHISLCLKSDQNSYLINTKLNKRLDVTAYLKSLNFDDSGFSAVIANAELETGDYKIGIYIKKDNIEGLEYTDLVIRIENR